MRYLKKFEGYSRRHKIEEIIGGFTIEVDDAGPNNYDGGVQIDSATVTCDGRDYYFELGTPVGGGGEVYATYLGSDDPDPEFLEHFGLNEKDKFYKSNKELLDFLQVNSPDCVGDTTGIDEYDLEITDFNHDGGMEFGYINTIINGKEIDFEMIQSNTGNFESTINFQTDRDEEAAKEIGFEITDEVNGFLYDVYDVISSEKR